MCNRGGISPHKQSSRVQEEAVASHALLVKKIFNKTFCGFRNPGQRFETSKNGKEVCDRMTGDIWEQDPDSFDPIANPDGRMKMNQPEAIAFCANLDKGHGKVYELPSVEQLVGVLNFREFNPPLTPDVFDNVLSEFYWSASTYAGPELGAWAGSSPMAF
jgi:hypothetical protein